AVQFACQLFLRRVCGWDRLTAFFGAVPGVTSYVLVLALGQPTRADIPRVALSQTVRVFLLVGLTPSVLTLVEGTVAATAMAIGSLPDLALTLVAAVAGGLAFRLVGIPAAPMIGAMVASAVLHGGGLATGAFPPVLQNALLVALGALIGSRFDGTTPAMLRGMLAASLGAFAVAVAVAGFGAWLTAMVTGFSFSQMALAFAPGGLDVMTAMAFALNLDTAFVAAHQLVRFFAITVYAPALARRIASRRSE
ncbi:MAG: AbrB family transcriptional regulator, partial [Bauldia sp.]